MYDYDPDQKPKTSKEERDKMMKKFLEKGGKVKKLEPVSYTHLTLPTKLAV